MRKILAFLMIVMLVAGMVAMTGCGEEKKLTVSDGILTVAVSPDFAPMEFVDTSKSGQEQYVGFDITLAKAVATEMGLELLIKPMSFEACQTAVQSGIVDMSISGYVSTPERAERFLLSDFYMPRYTDTAQVIVVKKENAGKYKTAEDFAGLSVGAQASSLQKQLSEEQLPESTEVVEYAEMEKAIAALEEGKIQAIAVAQYYGSSAIAQNPNLAFSGFSFETNAEQEQNVVLLPKGREDLAEYVNRVIARITESGEIVEWYEEAKTLADTNTAADISYDDEGEEL